MRKTVRKIVREAKIDLQLKTELTDSFAHGLLTVCARFHVRFHARSCARLCVRSCARFYLRFRLFRVRFQAHGFAHVFASRFVHDLIFELVGSRLGCHGIVFEFGLTWAGCGAAVVAQGLM